MEIKGSIEEIRFRNEENGYTIVVLDVEGEPVTCVGTFPPVSEGEFVSAQGDYTVHHKFGRQFKAQRVFSAQPDSEDSVIKYLGSGLISGVGPKTALAIVNKFKSEALETIEFSPQKLSLIKGISKKKALLIGEEYAKIKKMRDAVMYLQAQSISITLALKIYKKYGDDTIAKVKTNPYRLIEDIDGVGFITADKIALEAGINRDSAFRISAGIIYTLIEAAERGGNTFLPKEKLTESAASLLKLDLQAVESNYEKLILESKIKLVKTDECGDGVMFSQFYRAEKTAAVKLVELIEQANKIPIDAVDIIAEFERAEQKTLHEAQKNAVCQAVQGGAAVITGGPGTGKTLITKCILRVLDANRLSYMLTAPTGRAAKRLSDSTGVDAFTIHRALMSAECADGKFSADVIIVDEFSMVDIFLFVELLKALRAGAKLIMIGDCDQLPSVGAGNVLKDIIESEILPVVKLTEVYRQSEQSLITLNAHAINRGEMPQLFNKASDFFFIKESDPEKIPDLIASLVSKRLPSYLGAGADRVQVLCPVKNGTAGTYNLNTVLQNALNPNQNCAEAFEDGQKFKEGDRVMHTANNYSLKWVRFSKNGLEEGEGVFNGDMGYIQKIYTQSGEIEVLFEDGRQTIYSPEFKSQLILSYAITVHKSQGSEFDAVIMPVVGGNKMIFTRNLLYTAITRAKRIVVLLGEEYNIKRMVDNNYVAQRFSLLKSLIKDIRQKYSLLYNIDGDNTNG